MRPGMNVTSSRSIIVCKVFPASPPAYMLTGSMQQLRLCLRHLALSRSNDTMAILYQN